ncbi:hypothetical protein [Streptosporangium saharense]|uniref:VOC domain-containing protein n=1 Tax=Streptosporangium saharense TaxID=1706840 RepID=A0A7W7VLP8_9ACTN|nr:hypothetical protein [Streptosporangium saharense]MBB4914986.1 hypothetical protein [Streptosporangium saharense]
MRFGPDTLWLRLHTDDLDAAAGRLAAIGIHPCDEVEPLENLDSRSHRIENPAGFVHLLVALGDRPGRTACNRDPLVTSGSARRRSRTGSSGGDG